MNKSIKRILLFPLITLVAFLSFGVTTSYAADPSGWQLIDTDTVNSSNLAYLDGAEGGNARVCLDFWSGSRINLYDNDGNGVQSSKKINSSSSIYLGDGECYSFNVEPYVDGSDNDAEIIVKVVRSAWDGTKFELWD